MAVPEAAATPKSAHVADPALAPFLQHHFDPAEYLNAALPSLSLSAVSSRPLKQGPSASLPDLSSQTQQLLAQLNAHTTRLSTILTQLTDDILRSGARLAYEVEVLRGEAIGLTETLSDGLKGDVEKFVPSGILVATPQQQQQQQQQQDDDAKAAASPISKDQDGHPTATAGQTPPADAEADADTTPEYIGQLRVLTLVRTRLESVIKVFGEAMHWTIPPSEISLASSLISVSAPEPGSDASSREQKGKEFAASLRTEIADLIAGNPEGGVEAANVRIQALRDLAQVWKGTAEEKARTKFVEGLAKLAEEKQREIEREKNKQRGTRSGSIPKPTAQPAAQLAAPQRTGGFLDNLQRIRENYI